MAQNTKMDKIRRSVKTYALDDVIADMANKFSVKLSELTSLMKTDNLAA